LSKNNKVLLFWITWSWKTEIYIKLIRDTIEEWKQALFLIPEIILWNQTLDKIKEVFWNDVIILNSTVSAAKRTKYFLDILHNKARIILWTRSALFYPYNNLWIIIIDEEHDNSYISEQSPRYNTIELAEKISEFWSIKLLLGSWTPSINSMYKAVKEEYELVNLLEKYDEM
jgi:primosomal protein N' (replication factor Y)